LELGIISNSAIRTSGESGARRRTNRRWKISGNLLGAPRNRRCGQVCRTDGGRERKCGCVDATERRHHLKSDVGVAHAVDSAPTPGGRRRQVAVGPSRTLGADEDNLRSRAVATMAPVREASDGAAPWMERLLEAIKASDSTPWTAEGWRPHTCASRDAPGRVDRSPRTGHGWPVSRLNTEGPTPVVPVLFHRSNWPASISQVPSAAAGRIVPATGGRSA